MKKILIIISLIAACGVYVAEGQINTTSYTFWYIGTPPCNPDLNSGWQVSHGSPDYVPSPDYDNLQFVSSYNDKDNTSKSEGAFVSYNFSKNNNYRIRIRLKINYGSPKIEVYGANSLYENKDPNCDEAELPTVSSKQLIGGKYIDCTTGYFCIMSFPSDLDKWNPNGNYSYLWITSNNPGNSSSFIVNEVFIEDFGKVESIPPTVPGNLRTKVVEHNKITVQWDASYDASGVAGYEVFLNNVSKGTTSRTEYTFSNLTKCTPYTIEVRAYDIYDNYSAKTPPLSVQTLDDKPGDIVLDKPIILAGGQQIEEATNTITLKAGFSVAATNARELFHAKIVPACPGTPSNILQSENENQYYTEEDEDFFMSLLSEESNELQIYPNPTSDKITVRYRQFTGVEKITIFDIMGRLVLDDNLSGVVSEIDVSAFPSGVYFIKVITQDKALMKKLIKK